MGALHPVAHTKRPTQHWFQADRVNFRSQCPFRTAAAPDQLDHATVYFGTGLSICGVLATSSLSPTQALLASVAERRDRAPTFNGKRAMNAIIYPLYLHRDFERRWATRMAGVESVRSRPRGTVTCECGNVVGATHGFSRSPAGAHQSRCAACGRQQEMAADLSSPSGRRLECER
jgi:hypothetical protein